MSSRLSMAEHQAILGLARLNWSYRRIAAELGIDRETVSQCVKAAVPEQPRVAPLRSNHAHQIIPIGQYLDKSFGGPSSATTTTK